MLLRLKMFPLACVLALLLVLRLLYLVVTSSQVLRLQLLTTVLKKALKKPVIRLKPAPLASRFKKAQLVRPQEKFQTFLIASQTPLKTLSRRKMLLPASH